MPSQRETNDIFRLEYHPVGKAEHRIRVVVNASDDLQVVTERRTGTGWEQVDVEDIGYFEYSDEDMRRGELDPEIPDLSDVGDNR